MLQLNPKDKPQPASVRSKFIKSVTAISAVALAAIPAITFATGNGAPSGAHYNLNLIGVPNEKTADMTNNDGHRIFVKLSGNTKINLTSGEFKVLDANGTDGTAAFQLPAPDADNDGVTSYSVYARAVGTPGGNGQITTCAIDPITLEEVCSLATTLSLKRDTGKPTFQNVSKSLLYVFADLDGDGNLERYPLFSDALQDYYWSYDNNGLKVVQLRFYEIPTDTNVL